MTGLAYMQDFGVVSGPIGITSSNAVGHVYAGIQEWAVEHTGEAVYPVVAETWDGWQSDINGFHVRPETAKVALDAARGGPMEEGVVGGGTGMHCFSFKGGIGTSSRAIMAGGKSLHCRRSGSVQHGRPQGAARRGRSGRAVLRGTAGYLVTIPGNRSPNR